MARRDVGATGESFAQTLAESAGIVVVRSNPDKHGWDQLWELQRPDEAAPNTLPLDLRSSRATCKIQIKSGVGLTKAPPNNGRSGVWRDVKLSTWLELCGFLGPAFFLVLDFDNDETHIPRKGFLVHIGECWMTTTLKNARIRKVPPHKTRQSLNFMAVEEVLPLNAKGLAEALDDAIGPDPMAYAIRKREFWNSVGYGERAKDLVVVRSKVNPEFPNPIDELVSLALGFTELRFDSFERHDNRFSAPVLMESAGEGVFRFRPPDLGPALVKIEQCATGDTLAIESELYSTISLAPCLPPEHARCRLVTHCFEFIFGLTGGTCSIRLRDPRAAGVRVPIHRLVEHGKFINLLLSARQNPLRVEVSLQGSHSRSWYGEVSGAIDDEDDARRTALSFQAADAIVRQLSIGSALEVNPVALCEQREDLQILYSLLSGDTVGCRIEFAGDDPPPYSGIIVARGAALREDCFVYAVGVLHGRSVASESRLVLNPISRHLVSSGRCASPEDAKACIREGVQRAQDWLQDNNIVRLPIGIREPSGSDG